MVSWYQFYHIHWTTQFIAQLFWSHNLFNLYIRRPDLDFGKPKISPSFLTAVQLYGLPSSEK